MTQLYNVPNWTTAKEISDLCRDASDAPHLSCLDLYTRDRIWAETLDPVARAQRLPLWTELIDITNSERSAALFRESATILSR